jgi:hypothetical protein
VSPYPEHFLMWYATELFAIWYLYHAGQKQKQLVLACSPLCINLITSKPSREGG